MSTAKQEGWRRQIRFRLPAWGKVAAMFLLCIGIGIFATRGDRLEYYTAPGVKSDDPVPSGSWNGIITVGAREKDLFYASSKLSRNLPAQMGFAFEGNLQKVSSNIMI